MAVSCLKICADEKSFLSGSWDKTIKVGSFFEKEALPLILHDILTYIQQWNLDDGSLIGEYGALKSQVTSIEFCPTSPAIFAATSFEGAVYLFELGSSEPKAIITPLIVGGSPPWSASLCWSLDGRFLYCARRNETVDEIDAETGKILRTLRFPKDSGWVSCVAMLPDNRHLVWYFLFIKFNVWNINCFRIQLLERQY